MNFAQAIREVPSDTPWLHHGRDVKMGLDCVGFVMEVYRRVGLPFDDLDVPYDLSCRNATRGLEMLAQGLSSRFSAVKDSRDGDIILLRIQRFPTHLGIVCGDRIWHMAKYLDWSLVSRVSPWIYLKLRHNSLLEH